MNIEFSRNSKSQYLLNFDEFTILNPNKLISIRPVLDSTISGSSCKGMTVERGCQGSGGGENISRSDLRHSDKLLISKQSANVSANFTLCTLLSLVHIQFSVLWELYKHMSSSSSKFLILYTLTKTPRSRKLSAEK